MVRLSFLGDIALVGEYNRLYAAGINPFEQIKGELGKSHLVIGNLESVSEGRKGENPAKNPRLKTEHNTLNLLNALGTGMLTLAQNHVYDNLEDGLHRTIEFFEKHDIKYLGAGFSPETAEAPFVTEIEGLQFGFLNYVTRDTNPNIPETSNVFVNYFTLQKAERAIASLKKKVHFIILLLHWGGRVEGGYYPDWQQPKIARKLVEAGADLIIGHHSHTFQPFESYKGKYIFYSLGNFCFADYYTGNRIKKLDKRKRIKSAIVHINFHPSGAYSYSLQPFVNDDLIIRDEPEYIKKIHFRNRVFKYLKKYYLLWKFYYLYHKNIDPIFYFLSRDDLNARQKLSRLGRRITR